MITSDQFIAQAAQPIVQAPVATPQVVYIPTPATRRGSGGFFLTLLVAGVLVGGALGLKKGAISITPLQSPVATVVAQGPAVLPTVLPPAVPTLYVPAQPAPIVSQAQVVVEPQAQLRVAATALPPTMTADPNLTRLVAIINSTPTQIVAGPPECNSVNATYHAKTTVVDEKKIPIGVAEGWSCDSQAAAEAEMDRRANEMLHK